MGWVLVDDVVRPSSTGEALAVVDVCSRDDVEKVGARVSMMSCLLVVPFKFVFCHVRVQSNAIAQLIHIQA